MALVIVYFLVKKFNHKDKYAHNNSMLLVRLYMPLLFTNVFLNMLMEKFFDLEYMAAYITKEKLWSWRVYLLLHWGTIVVNEYNFIGI